MFTEKTTKILEFVTEFINGSNVHSRCCGLSWYVDSHEDIKVIETEHVIFGNALTIVVESHVHCPVCNECKTIETNFGIGQLRADLIEND